MTGIMPDTFKQDFAKFVQERVRPAIDKIAERKRSGLVASIGIGAAVFVVFSALSYFILAPYKELLGEKATSYWPLMIVAPAALAMLSFTIAYILSLRNTVTDFRETLITRMAEFIDPSLVRQNSKEFGAAAPADSLLFTTLGEPVSGRDRFLGHSGAASVEFRDIHIPREKDQKAAPSGDGENKPGLTGIFMKAVYPNAFREPLFVFPKDVEASRSALEQGLKEKWADPKGGLVRIDDTRTLRQILKPADTPGLGDPLLSTPAAAKLDALRKEWGSELYMGCFGNDLYVALLSRTKRMDLPGAFEGFDFGNCREFCHAASTAMELARELGDRADLWAPEAAGKVA